MTTTLPAPQVGRGEAPRGWAQLAMLGPLHGSLSGTRCGVVLGCTALAVVLTPDGPRCGDHPPLNGVPGRRGWGYALDWTPWGGNTRDRLIVAAQRAIEHNPVPPPRLCRDPRCGCGRCPFYATAGVPESSGYKPARKGGLSTGRRRRDAGQALAAAGSDPWSKAAARALHDLASLRVDFTADDLVARVGLPNTSETNRNNAVGAAFSAASRAHIIGRTGATEQSKREESHGRWQAVWRGV